MPDIFQVKVNFADGEGIDFVDFNELQERVNSFIADGILSGLSRLSEFDETGATVDQAYAVGNGGAPFDGAGTREVKNAGGLILQRVTGGTPDGVTPDYLAYFVEPDEYGQVLPVATVNPRWDVIEVTLADVLTSVITARDSEDAVTGALTSEDHFKLRRTTATFNVVTGVEAASPVEPATTAGAIKLAAFLVTPAMGAFDPRLDIRDYRFPIGTMTSDMRDAPGLWSFSGASGWTIARDSLTDGAGANETARTSSNGGAQRRLLRIGVAANLATGPSTVSVLVERFGLADPGFQIDDLTSLFTLGSGFEFIEKTYIDPTPGSGQIPIWGNGYAAGFAAGRAGVVTAKGREAVAILFASDQANDEVFGAHFLFTG